MVESATTHKHNLDCSGVGNVMVIRGKFGDELRRLSPVLHDLIVEYVQ